MVGICGGWWTFGFLVLDCWWVFPLHGCWLSGWLMGWLRRFAGSGCVIYIMWFGFGLVVVCIGFGCFGCCLGYGGLDWLVFGWIACCLVYGSWRLSASGWVFARLVFFGFGLWLVFARLV